MPVRNITINIHSVIILAMHQCALNMIDYL